MWRSVHKRANKRRGYEPDFGKQAGSSTGHGGNMPPGKQKRMNRVKTQRAGFPQGVHIKDASKDHPQMDMCFCGGCFEKNNGTENLKYG